jgi:hypothetical protein
MFVIFYSSVIGTESSTAESLQPESNKENLLREGLLHCKITLVDGKVISLILKMKVQACPPADSVSTLYCGPQNSLKIKETNGS